MNNYYVIVGTTGEHSDHQFWLESAHESEKDAQTRASFLNEKLKVLSLHCESEEPTDWDAKEVSVGKMRLIDENFKHDYTGSEYEVSKMPRKSPNL